MIQKALETVNLNIVVGEGADSVKKMVMFVKTTALKI